MLGSASVNPVGGLEIIFVKCVGQVNQSVRVFFYELVRLLQTIRVDSGLDYSQIVLLFFNLLFYLFYLGTLGAEINLIRKVG